MSFMGIVWATCAAAQLMMGFLVIRKLDEDREREPLSTLVYSIFVGVWAVSMCFKILKGG